MIKRIRETFVGAGGGDSKSSEPDTRDGKSVSEPKVGLTEAVLTDTNNVISMNVKHHLLCLH